MSSNEKGMNVRIAQLPGSVKTLPLDETVTWTVGKVLAEAQMSAQGFEIRVNGNPADLNTPVTADQTILLVRPVQGN